MSVSSSTKLWRNKVALVSAIFLVVITLMAIFAPYVSHYAYDAQDISARLQTPSLQHLMGTDPLGRDLESRILYGARLSLAVGVCTALFAFVLGTLTGAIAGYAGGWVDSLITRVLDLFYVFPSLLLAILLMIVMGRGFTGIFLAIGLTSWVTHARLVRGQVMQARELPYVEAARSVGANHGKIIFRHILPNLLGPMIVSLTAQVPSNIMAESFLSFIGLGLQPPYSSWGTLANEGFRAMRSYPHLILFPATALFLTLLAFNLLGDGLRDAWDPKMVSD